MTNAKPLMSRIPLFFSQSCSQTLTPPCTTPHIKWQHYCLLYTTGNTFFCGPSSLAASRTFFLDCKRVFPLNMASLGEREKMSQEREEDLAAREAQIGVQEKIITLRKAISAHRESLASESAAYSRDDQLFDEPYFAGEEEQDGPLFEYRAEDSDDEELLERIGYDRDAALTSFLNLCEYDYQEVSDQEMLDRRLATGMADFNNADLEEIMAAKEARGELVLHLEQEDEDDQAVYLSDDGLDVVPDEAQLSKRMPAQDWALKHETLAELFGGGDRGGDILHRFGGEDAMVINAHSDQRGRIKGRTFAWSSAAKHVHQAGVEEDNLPDYEDSDAASDDTIILENQDSRPHTGILLSDNGVIRNVQPVHNAQATAAAAADERHQLEVPMSDAQAIAAAASRAMLSETNEASQSTLISDGSSVNPTLRGINNARAIRQAASAARANLPSPNTFKKINSALLTSNDDPFVNSPSQGSLSFGTRTPLADVTGRTLASVPVSSARDGLLAIDHVSSRIGNTYAVASASGSSSHRPTSTVVINPTSISSTSNRLPRSTPKRKLSTIEDDREYDADDGGVASAIDEAKPKKKASKKHFADQPRSRYRGAQVPSDDEVEYRDTLERM